MPEVHRSLALFLRTPIPVNVERNDAEQALKHPGFQLVRSKGSHFMWSHPEDGRMIVYKLAGGRRLDIKATKDIRREILRQGYGG